MIFARLKPSGTCIPEIQCVIMDIDPDIQLLKPASQISPPFAILIALDSESLCICAKPEFARPDNRLFVGRGGGFGDGVIEIESLLELLTVHARALPRLNSPPPLGNPAR